MFKGVEPFVQFWQEEIIREFSVNLFRIRTSCSEGGVVLRYFLYRALAAPLFRGTELMCNFGRRHHAEYFCEII